LPFFDTTFSKKDKMLPNKGPKIPSFYFNREEFPKSGFLKKISNFFSVILCGGFVHYIYIQCHLDQNMEYYSE
jgi:hypothetical protein